jgi:hypothetical protein
MLPQLKYIEIVKDLNINQLRHQVMGTVLTRSSSSDRTLIKSTPAGIVEVLNRIRAHPSKASGTYYSRFYLRYFLDLDRSIRKISRALKPQGTLTLVSQGSWYKDIFVDLPSLIISVAECYGLQLEWSSVFRPGGHMAFINRRSHASTQAAPPEVVAIFRKQKVDR